MASKKRKSVTIERARKRLSGIESIDPALDLGNGLTVKNYRDQIEGLETKLDGYNKSLSDADDERITVTQNEKSLRALSEQYLEAVGVKFGHDSNEYEQAGGTRKSMRKRPVRKKKI